ncbi:Serine/threonine kinase [Diaporthe australafricana]|uniref:protein kinase C n=1 Tax=Diaporthe australafricana TaxID=127596 RepID=A0ABR3WFM3_9PEZI
MADEDKMMEVYKKIEREKSLIQAANLMRQQTNNDTVRSKLDTQMREGKRNLEFFEEKLKELQLRRGMQGMDMGSGGSSSRPHGARSDSEAPPTPPPKDASGNATSGGETQFSQIGGHSDLMPPRHPFAPPGPGSGGPKPRPNFTKLDLIKYDTPYLGPRIQLMLSQIQFKLNVEEQYLKGVEKMVQLYQMEGDKKSRADAAARKVESRQKITLLKQALKRYEELHIDTDSAENSDDDSINMPNLRKPLSGQLTIRVVAVKDVDHAPTGRFSRTPDTFVAVKVEDAVVARTRATRNDRWEAEYHNIDVDKANEIELTVYDKPGEHALPIGLLWVRISDIAEELRRKRIEAEINNSGWVSADRMANSKAAPSQFPMNPQQPQPQFGPPPTSPGYQSAQATYPPPQAPQHAVSQPIDGWFNLEPTGQILLNFNFIKQTSNTHKFDVGLGRKGAVRQRKEEIHEMYGHKFVSRQFYNIMRCAFCADFLKYSAECALTAHAQCVHLVPDFCGMSMTTANQILEGMRTQKQRQSQRPSMSERTLRSGTTSPGASQASTLYDRTSGGSFSTVSPEAAEAARRTYGQPSPDRPGNSRMSSSTDAAAAATLAMSGAVGTQSPRPQQGGQQDYMGRQDSYGQPQQGQEDPYASQQHGSPTQGRRYNPADYANVNQYPQQPPVQQSRPLVQAQPQQSYQQPIAAPKPQPEPIAPSPTSSTVSAPLKKPLPSATDPGTGMRIGLDHFNFLAVLGKGNFGKVMLAETKRSRKLYAIKVLKKEFIIENDEVESIRSEKRVFLIANRERHPFLTNLHACFQTETRVYFVMEYISGGDLMLHIQRGQFGTKRAQFYAAEVCLALKYFHENGVVYRDLKLDNILLTLDGHIKIADYGLCKEDMWFGSTTSTFCGTPEFMAPEILLDKKYGRAVDWWAFGVLIYQMLLQQSPFRGEDEDEIYDAILADEPLYPIHMPRDSVSILQKLLIREPDQRLGSGPTDAQEVMSQPFFRNINWDDIYHKRVAPPFLPQIKSATDTSNFDSEFTSVTPVLTPVQSVLSQAMQEEFRGFSYTADFE